ncbi:partial putative HTH-type transcriptional repressor ExuR, partial [Anaerolineae bacterium]
TKRALRGETIAFSGNTDCYQPLEASYALTRRCLELCLAHRQRIGIITGLMEITSAGERLEGYKSALTDHNIAFDPDLVAIGDFWQPSAYQAALDLMSLKNPPTAIFASNDLSAFGAMEAVRESGLRIPEDVSIIGFDDVPQAALVHPKLTTVRQPLDQIGRVAVRMLLEQIDNPGHPPRRVTLATRLVVRDSCASRP